MSYAVWDAKLEKQVSNINAYNEAKMLFSNLQKGAVDVNMSKRNRPVN